MTRHEKRENDVNQNGGREHEHPHGQALPHPPQPSVHNRANQKLQGRLGQPNFIPGVAAVGEPGRPFKAPSKKK